MCGIAAIAGQGWQPAQLDAMVASQHHRGPDYSAVWTLPGEWVGLGHNRLSIIDLSPAGRQPMANHDDTVRIVFNGEIYNYRELRCELHDYPYRSRTDTEIVLAAYERWGESCLDHFLGMFAFVIWDGRKRRLLAARDRFGVKPLYYCQSVSTGTLFIASEIKALHAGGAIPAPDPVSWATYFTYGLYDHSERTFWQDIQSLPAGHAMSWQDGMLKTWRWYDLAERSGPELDARPLDAVVEEYASLLADSVRLRFRSDVAVGVNLSGGLDSSTLLGLVQAVQGPDSDIKAFTFATGDAEYDELPWVRQMLERTRHPSVVCSLTPEKVPELARSVQHFQDEPFGGLPTIAYANIFAQARREDVIVLLDGQGMDEQWGGYDYYRNYAADQQLRETSVKGPVQGSRSRSVQPQCLIPEFRARARALTAPNPFTDALRNRQYLDAVHAKIPRALRFNDRISMRASTELREPFLDHRLFELALRQAPERKISGSTQKQLLRQLTQALLPQGVVEAPKRAVQTPQREWLRGPLKEWAGECIETALSAYGDMWFHRKPTEKLWQDYCRGTADNSFYVWQWINLGLWHSYCLTR